VTPAAGVPWQGGTWRWIRAPGWGLLVLSLAVQLGLALLLGHARDTRLFMAAGYLVGSGRSPYTVMDLTGIFHHAGFKSIAVIGYPPPWPLVLGVIYRGAYGVGHHLLVYNLAIKLPVIAANLGLAYLVAALLRNLGVSQGVVRRAWIALLFNPLLLYVGAAWGQIDAVATLLALAALVLLASGRPDLSAAALAVSICTKPTAAPILLVVFTYLLGRSLRGAARYAAVFLVAAFVLCIAPFPLLGWSASPLGKLNAQFMMTGTMSYMTVVRLAKDPLLLPGHWWLLGLLWVPALVAAAVVGLRHGISDTADLFRKSAALVLVFFLARTWLAEPNVVLVLALVLVLASLGELDRRFFTAIWVIALVFTVFNASPLQLLFVEFPRTMVTALDFVGRYSGATLPARAALVVAWQIVGWWAVVLCLRRRPAGATEAAAAAAALRAAGPV